MYRAGKPYFAISQARHALDLRTLFAGPVLAAAVLLSGCGVQYRPVVSTYNPVGPASQPTKYAVAVSSPSSTLPGLLTFVDFSGDTVLSTPNIQANPSYFAINSSGNTGYTINAAGTLDNFFLSNPTALLTNGIGQTTLPVGSGPVSISAISPATSSSASVADIFVPEKTTSHVAVLNAGTNTLVQDIAVTANPVYVVGVDSAPRIYAISQGATAGGNGTISSLEAISSSSLAVTATIAVGASPVYGVMTADARRAFILNQGSGTVSVVNVVNNALDVTTPTITLPQIALPGGGTTAPRPIWADFLPVNNQLVVLNEGDGVHPGSLSIISIPLCTATSLPSNPNCNAANPVDAAGFGTIVATVPVGINPLMVSVLRDAVTPRAYVVNQGIPATTAGGAETEGSISVVNLISDVATATISGVSTAALTAGAATSPSQVYGHPATVAATVGTPTGKVYVTSFDNQYLTVLYTDTDTVETHIALQGLGVRVLVTQP